MSREGEYRQLADDMFRRAANEQNAQLEAQWKILGAKYVVPGSRRKEYVLRSGPKRTVEA